MDSFDARQLKEAASVISALMESFDARQLSEVVTTTGGPVKKDPGFQDAEKVAQIFSGVFFTGLALWLVFANGTKLSFIQRASLEKRLTVCCFINTYVGVFSAFFNFFQLTEVDNIMLPDSGSFVLDFARPFEWLVTCPLMQLVLVLMGGSKIPEYRRVFMPTLSAMVLVCGTASMISSGVMKLVFYGIGILFAAVMWFHNFKQIKEHSNGEETMLSGDSEFRKASVLLIATWFPFPIWFIISPEGLGLLDNVLIIQVGWAFLNIVSKFTFIFYIQRIKDNYCNRLKVKRELFGASNAVGAMAMLDDIGGPTKGRVFDEREGVNGMKGMTAAEEGRKHQSELGAVVVETMTFLGMSQHTERFSRLLYQAEISSTDQVAKLTHGSAEELQLPWDLICALQRRIQVWQLEMRDTTELELEKGEKHYRPAHDIQPFVVPQEEVLAPVPWTGIESRMENIEEAMSKHEDKITDIIIGRMQGMFQGVLEKAELYHSAQLRQLYEVEGNMRRCMQETDTQASLRGDQIKAEVMSRFDQQMGVLASHERRVEDIIQETAERGERNVESASRDLQAKQEGCTASAMRQQAELAQDITRQSDEALTKAVSLVSVEIHKEISQLAGDIGNVCGNTVQKWTQEVQKATLDVQSAMQAMHATATDVQATGNEVKRMVEKADNDNQRGCMEVNETVTNLRRAMEVNTESMYDKNARMHMDLESNLTRKLEDVATKTSTMQIECTNRGVDGVHNAIGMLAQSSDLATVLTRHDQLGESMRGDRDVSKEGVAELRRLSMMIMDQANAGHERIHLSAGKIAELHRTTEHGMDRILRNLGEVGMGMSVQQTAGLTHTATPPVGSAMPRWSPNDQIGCPGSMPRQMTPPGCGQMTPPGCDGFEPPISCGGMTAAIAHQVMSGDGHHGSRQFEPVTSTPPVSPQPSQGAGSRSPRHAAAVNSTSRYGMQVING